MAPSTWLLWGKCQRNGSPVASHQACTILHPSAQDAEVITCEGIAKFDVTAHGEKYLGKRKPPSHICHPAPSKTREGALLPHRAALEVEGQFSRWVRNVFPPQYCTKSKSPDYTYNATDRFLACSGLKAYVNTATDKDLYSNEFFLCWYNISFQWAFYAHFIFFSVK